MELFVDDQPFSGNIDQQQSLAQLAQEICTQHGEPGERMVVAVACDGQVIGQDALEETLAASAGQFERVDLTTMPVAQLVEATLSQAQTLFEEGAIMRHRCADHLSEGRQAEAMDDLRTFCDIWQQVQDCIRVSAAAAHLNLDEISHDGLGFADVLGDVKQLLGELKEAMEHRDSVMVADILRYEFDAPTQSWQRLMDALQERLGN